MTASVASAWPPGDHRSGHRLDQKFAASRGEVRRRSVGAAVFGEPSAQPFLAVVLQGVEVITNRMHSPIAGDALDGTADCALLAHVNFVSLQEGLQVVIVAVAPEASPGFACRQGRLRATSTRAMVLSRCNEFGQLGAHSQRL